MRGIDSGASRRPLLCLVLLVLAWRCAVRSLRQLLQKAQFSAQIEQSALTKKPFKRFQPSPGLVCAQTMRSAPCHL